MSGNDDPQFRHRVPSLVRYGGALAAVGVLLVLGWRYQEAISQIGWPLRLAPILLALVSAGIARSSPRPQLAGPRINRTWLVVGGVLFAVFFIGLVVAWVLVSSPPPPSAH